MFLVGVSKVDITPPVGISHSGWGAAIHEQAEGVDMPMYAYVLLIETESSADKVVIVDVDLGGVPDGLDNKIRDSITKEVDIDPQNIRISATHTHAGPVWDEDHGGGDGSWVVGGKEYIKPYYDSIPIKIGEAAKSAANKKTKCHISHGIGRSDININRRPADENGNLFTGRNWNGVVDHSVDISGSMMLSEILSRQSWVMPAILLYWGLKIDCYRLTIQGTQEKWLKKLSVVCVYFYKGQQEIKGLFTDLWVK